MAVMQMTLTVEGTGDQGVYAITKVVQGNIPPIGRIYIFRLPFESGEGFVWMTGSIMGRVTRVIETEENGVVTGVHVELKTMSMTFVQFQEVVRAPWLKNFGWQVTDEVIPDSNG